MYEAWRWAPLAKGESLAHQVLAIGRMSSRRDWFREGEQLNDAQKRIADMATFVGNFTTVNRGEWNTVMGEIARNHSAPALDVYDAVTRLCI